ncbi:hypothetical protein D3C76_812130 [compost metagenome]
MQPLGAAFLHAAAGNDPVSAHGGQAIARPGGVEQCAQGGTQVGGLGQAGGLIVNDQATTVGISDGVALGIEQHNLGSGRHHVFGQGGRELGQGQVGGDHGMFAAASRQGGADIVGREKNVGLSGDLVHVLAGAGKPATATRIIGFVEVVLTADQRQVLIEKQRLRMHLATAVSLDAPYLVGRGVRGLEQRLQIRRAQRAHHEKVTGVVPQVQRRQVGIVLERLAEGLEQRQALLQVGGLGCGVVHQQA